MQETKPTKEAVRSWINRDRKKDSNQTIEEVKRQLGWFLTDKRGQNV
jgi:hypothetical protein